MADLLTFQSRGMDHLSSQERVSLLEAQIRRREAELQMMHEANRLAVLTLELEKAALEEANGVRQIEKLTFVHDERASRAEAKDMWIKEMSEQLEELQVVNQATREEHAETIRKANSKVYQEKKRSVAEVKALKEEEDRLYRQQMEEHRLKGALNLEREKESQEQLKARLAKEQRLKAKNARAMVKERDVTLKLKQEMQVEHAASIQDFRKEVDVLALRQRLEKDAARRSKTAARAHAREVEEVEKDRAFVRSQEQKKVEKLHESVALQHDYLKALREQREQEKVAAGQKRYDSEVAEALEHEAYCAQEVSRLQAEAEKIEQQMAIRHRKISKNTKRIAELNNKGDAEALKAASAASKRRLAESQQRAAELRARTTGVKAEPEEKGEWKFVNGKHQWVPEPPKAMHPNKRKTLSATSSPPHRNGTVGASRPHSAMPRLFGGAMPAAKAATTSRALAQQAGAAPQSPRTPRAQPTWAAQMHGSPTPGTHRYSFEQASLNPTKHETEHAYFSDTDARDLSSPQDQFSQPSPPVAPMEAEASESDGVALSPTSSADPATAQASPAVQEPVSPGPAIPEPVVEVNEEAYEEADSPEPPQPAEQVAAANDFFEPSTPAPAAEPPLQAVEYNESPPAPPVPMAEEQEAALADVAPPSPPTMEMDAPVAAPEPVEEEEPAPAEELAPPTPEPLHTAPVSATPEKVYTFPSLEEVAQKPPPEEPVARQLEDGIGRKLTELPKDVSPPENPKPKKKGLMGKLFGSTKK